MITRWTVAAALWLGAALSAGCAHRPARAEAAPEATAPADARKGAAEPSDEQRFRDAIAVVRRLKAQHKAPDAPAPPASTPPAAPAPAPEAPAQDPSRH